MSNSDVPSLAKPTPLTRLTRLTRRSFAPILLIVAVAPNALAQSRPQPNAAPDKSAPARVVEHRPLTPGTANAATTSASPSPSSPVAPGEAPSAAPSAPPPATASAGVTAAEPAPAPEAGAGTPGNVAQASRDPAATPAAPNSPISMSTPAKAAPSAQLASVPPASASSACSQAWMRDGFYFRSLFASGWLNFHGTGPSGDASVNGLGGGNLLAIGGSVTKGLVLAGTLQFLQVTGKLDGGPYRGALFDAGKATHAVSQNVAATASQIGVLVDWYPTETGLHIGLGAGLYAAGLKLQADDASMVGTGAAGTLLVGYDWPVSRTIALGVNLIGSASTRMKPKYDGERTSGYELSSQWIGLGASFLYF